MGRVYLANHHHLSRLSALKVLFPKIASQNYDFVKQFQMEARAAASLSHPNVVTTHAIVEEDGYHFIEMEYVPGRSLQQLLDDERKLTSQRSTNIMVKIASGLAAAHQVGIIHRDLKPDNILVQHDGTPKIVDFGLAKRVLSETGAAEEKLVGTPNFIAPEVFQGELASPASDVYALGVCYYLLLTGRLPFVCSSLSELKKSVLTDPVPNIRDNHPEISLAIAETLSVLLSKSQKNRPQNAVEAMQLLDAISGQVEDIETLLVDAFRGRDNVKWIRDGEKYLIQVHLPMGRKQSILLEPSSHASAEKLLMFSSICGPVKSEYFEHALKLNSEIMHGALAIREIDGESRFVMVDTYPRTTVDAEEVRCSVLALAHHADAIENLITGLDQY